MISTNSKPRLTYLLITLLVAVVATPACYTLLKHPRVSQINYNRPTHDRCVDCHTNDEIWGFHHLPHSGTKDVPWWYERFWGYDETSDLETVPLRHHSLETPGELGAPAPGATRALTGKQTSPAPATVKEKKEKGDGKNKDKPNKSRRPVQPKGEKKKKAKKKTPHD